MGVTEHRSVVDADGRLWRELHEDGVLVARELRPMRDQPAKVRLEMAMADRWADWWRWKTTREEAVSRGMAPAVVTALRGREDAAWVAYAVAIVEWRAA